MSKYKVAVSKWQTKHTIIISAASEEEAREKIHKDGYSILSLEITTEETVFKGKRFLFTIREPATKELKQWVVIGDDIFKVYLKLRKELGYDVVTLYDEAEGNIDESEKLKIIASLKEQFNIFSLTAPVNQEPKTAYEKQQATISQNSQGLADFYVKKELDETYKLIDFVLKKLEHVLENAALYEVEDDQKYKLQEIYNGIIKIKKSTNVSKLKQVWETALLKIGVIELRHLEKNKTKEAKDLLRDTNKLLKQTGSTRQFSEKGRDYGSIFSGFVENINSAFSSKKTGGYVVRKSQEIDKGSYSYLKSVLLLNKYNAKLKENTKELMRNLHLYLSPFKESREKLDGIILKQKVIKQNISLLKAKKSGKVYSYTAIKKGYSRLVEYFIWFLYKARNYIFFTAQAYALTFLLYVNFHHYSFIQTEVNFNGIFYFIIVLLFLCGINLSIGLLTFILNVVILVLLFIFWVVNF